MLKNNNKNLVSLLIVEFILFDYKNNTKVGQFISSASIGRYKKIKKCF